MGPWAQRWILDWLKACARIWRTCERGMSVNPHGVHVSLVNLTSCRGGAGSGCSSWTCPGPCGWPGWRMAAPAWVCSASLGLPRNCRATSIRQTWDKAPKSGGPADLANLNSSSPQILWRLFACFMCGILTDSGIHATPWKQNNICSSHSDLQIWGFYWNEIYFHINFFSATQGKERCRNLMLHWPEDNKESSVSEMGILVLKESKMQTVWGFI